MALNDAVHWAADLGAGVRVALVQAGTFRSDAGALFGPVPRVLWGRLVADEIDGEGRLLQALNCLLIETPAGRVLVETGIGERLDERGRTWRALAGEPIVPALQRAGFEPASVDIVAMSHLHYDHAGGLLRADGTRAFPRARIVAQRAEWEIALDANPRIVASYDQPELRLVRAWGEDGGIDTAGSARHRGTGGGRCGSGVPDEDLVGCVRTWCRRARGGRTEGAEDRKRQSERQRSEGAAEA